MPIERLVRQALLAKPTGKRPRYRPRPRRWSNCISDLAWSRLDVSQQNYLKLLLTVRYSKFSYGCCPSNLPRGKAGMKMNEVNSIYVSLITGV